MRWVPDRFGRWRWRCRPGAVAIILAQLTQKSTIIAVLNAAALIAGWKLDPDKVDAIGVVLSMLDTVVLALVQEGAPPLPPPPADGCQP